MQKRQAPASPEVKAVRFTLPNGESIDVTKQRIHIGRTTEVLDDRRRLVRRNDLAIDDQTVSRAHAHIEHAAGDFRLFDDGSSYGTSVLHRGGLVEVPKSGARGQKIESGDEMYFGQSRVRFDIL
jgi:pSer/pThr/pTyr-binding forkhead associated (FHA) protein